MFKSTTVILTSALMCSLCYSASFSDDFEGYSNGTKPSKSNSLFSWTDSAYTFISSNKATSGTKSLMFYFKGNTDVTEDAWSEQRFRLGKIYDELWIRYKLWVPENYYHRDGSGGDNNKGLLLLWSGTYSGISHTSLHFDRPFDAKGMESPSNVGGSDIYASWKPDTNTAYNFHNPNDFRDDYYTTGDTITGIDRENDAGRWVDWVIHVKTSKLPVSSVYGTGNGAIQVWKDGLLTYNVINANNHSSIDGNNGWDQGYILGWANSGFDEDTYFYVDDFLIGTSANEIGFDLNSPVLGGATVEINMEKKEQPQGK